MCNLLFKLRVSHLTRALSLLYCWWLRGANSLLLIWPQVLQPNAPSWGWAGTNLSSCSAHPWSLSPRWGVPCPPSHLSPSPSQTSSSDPQWPPNHTHKEDVSSTISNTSKDVYLCHAHLFTCISAQIRVPRWSEVDLHRYPLPVPWN